MNWWAAASDLPTDIHNSGSYYQRFYENDSFAPIFNQQPNETLMHMNNETPLHNALSIIVPIFYGLIVVIGFLGNSLVVIVVLCDVHMRSTTNILIFNLALADLLFIVLCVPFTAVDYAMEYWPFGDLWCKIVQYLIYVSAYASIYTLVLMSLDRFLAVVHPVPSMSIRTEPNAYRAILILWIAIILLCLPILFVHGLEYADDNPPYCSVYQDMSVIFAPSVFLSSYAIPLTLAFVLYMCMLKRLWHSDIRTGRSSRCKRKVTRMVIVVVVTFAICWGPIHIVLTLRSQGLFDPSNSGTVIILICSQTLAYTNSCINPILYAFLSENFRKAFLKVIACGRGGGNSKSFGATTGTGGTISGYATGARGGGRGGGGGGGGGGGKTGTGDSKSTGGVEKKTIGVEETTEITVLYS